MSEESASLPRLIYGGVCAGFASAGCATLAFLALSIVMFGSTGGAVALMAQSLLAGGAAAAVVTCAVLIPVHLILVRSGETGRASYVLAMFLASLAALFLATRGGGELALFLVVLAALSGLSGGLSFRFIALTPARSGPLGNLDAVTGLLWGAVIAAFLQVNSQGPLPDQPPAYPLDTAGRIVDGLLTYGFAAMTALAVAALVRRNWSATGAAWLSAAGLVISLGFLVAAWLDETGGS